MNPVVEAVLSLAVVVGGVFTLLGAVGLARLPDFYTRLHAPTKASTLGVGGMLVASMINSVALGEPSARELLITLFVFVAAPVSAALLATAAFHLKARSVAPLPAVPRDTDAGARR
jgi:multicomponent K+:H+ antiporter subunit G